MLGKEVADQERAELLALKFIKRECDLIALQEVYGEAFYPMLKILVEKLSSVNHVEFKYTHNPKLDFLNTVVLYNSELLERNSLELNFSEVLPTFNIKETPKRIIRMPLVMFFRLKESGKKFALIDFHFKSKHAGRNYDPSGFSYEFERMKSAELVQNLFKLILPENTVILAGDRNSNIDSGSASILEGTSVLADYNGNNCFLGESAKVYCNKFRTANFTSLVYSMNKKQGSYNYKGKLQSIDDILIESSVNYFVSGGIDTYYPEASDHFMVWSKIWLT